MVVVWVCGGILEFTASLRGRGQGCSVPALPCHLREDEDKDGGQDDDHGGVDDHCADVKCPW